MSLAAFGTHLAGRDALARVRTTLLTVRRVAVGIAGLILLCGCAAEVGQTDLTLHQRAVFPDGTYYELGGFKMSEVDNDRANGPPKIPGNEVTVSVLVENAGKEIGSSDVAMSLAYHGDRGEELVPPGGGRWYHRDRLRGERRDQQDVPSRGHDRAVPDSLHPGAGTDAGLPGRHV